jgi:hypothetical protein
MNNKQRSIKEKVGGVKTGHALLVDRKLSRPKASRICHNNSILLCAYIYNSMIKFFYYYYIISSYINTPFRCRLAIQHSNVPKVCTKIISNFDYLK